MQNVDDLIAIDVHVHLEHTGDLTDADKQANTYFGASTAARDWPTLADYFRSRRIGCVVFPVDEKLTGRPMVPNDKVAEFAAEHSDIAIAFASIDPSRGADGVREAKRLVAGGGIRGLKLHPPLQQFAPNDRIAYPLYEVFAEAKLPVLFHTDLSAQAGGLHRLVWLVAEVLLADADSVRQHAAEAQSAVRLRLPAAHARSVDGGLPADCDSRRSASADPEAECDEAVWS